MWIANCAIDRRAHSAPVQLVKSKAARGSDAGRLSVIPPSDTMNRGGESGRRAGRSRR
ncbi:Hypothetical protein SMAX5B_006725 [Scophthalmus maximus]|uniref:Uncharacterized protein n=1 Tax=Scophthalmus maximus TaxID=52904 RepID=A0A2U9AVQ3_SCOMX|nr:Hypothetical protein SMAX5B_006725 [Scophthalmus maximus]